MLIRGRLLNDNTTGCPFADQYFVCITLKLIHSDKSLKMNTSKNICFVANVFLFV